MSICITGLDRSCNCARVWAKMSNAAPFHMQIQCRFNAAVIGQSEGVAGAKKLSARDFRVITWNCYRRKTPSQMPGPVPASASPRRQQMSYALRIVRNFESNQIRKQSINAERVSSLFSPSKFSNEHGHGELKLFLLHTKCQGWSWAVAARRCFAIRSF